MSTLFSNRICSGTLLPVTDRKQFSEISEFTSELLWSIQNLTFFALLLSTVKMKIMESLATPKDQIYKLTYANY